LVNRRRRIGWYVSSTIAGGWRDRQAPAAASRPRLVGLSDPSSNSACPDPLNRAPLPARSTPLPSAAAPARRRRQRLPSAPPPRQRPSAAPACAPARAHVCPASGGPHYCPRPRFGCSPELPSKRLQTKPRLSVTFSRTLANHDFFEKQSLGGAAPACLLCDPLRSPGVPRPPYRHLAIHIATRR
jgi:hypothetical protein